MISRLETTFAIVRQKLGHERGKNTVIVAVLKKYLSSDDGLGKSEIGTYM